MVERLDKFENGYSYRGARVMIFNVSRVSVLTDRTTDR